MFPGCGFGYTSVKFEKRVWIRDSVDNNRAPVLLVMDTCPKLRTRDHLGNAPVGSKTFFKIIYQIKLSLRARHRSLSAPNLPTRRPTSWLPSVRSLPRLVCFFWSNSLILPLGTVGHPIGWATVPSTPSIRGATGWMRHFMGKQHQHRKQQATLPFNLEI